MNRAYWLVIVSLLTIIVCWGREAAAGNDLIVLQDGSRKTGTLQGCVNASCQLNSQSIPQAAIAWIGLSYSGSPPPAVTVTDSATDEIHARNGSVESGRLVGISLSKVVTEKRSYDRTRVAWIHLALAAPVGGRATSRPAQPPGGGASRPGTSGQPGNKKSLPPWFDVKDCKNTDRVGKCWWTGVAPRSCNITICVCGLYIDKTFDEACTDALWYSLVPRDGLSVCCDEFKKGQGTHQPCDPTNDVDCDGVPNDKDRYPFDPNRSSE